jgi:hypothetical protein
VYVLLHNTESRFTRDISLSQYSISAQSSDRGIRGSRRGKKSYGEIQAPESHVQPCTDIIPIKGH